MAATDTQMVPVKGQTGLAWLVVLVLAVALAMFVIVNAFSAHNTPASINGKKAVYSHNQP